MPWTLTQEPLVSVMDLFFKFVRRGTNNLFCEWKHIFSYGSGPSIENIKQHLKFLFTIADI